MRTSPAPGVELVVILDPRARPRPSDTDVVALVAHALANGWLATVAELTDEPAPSGRAASFGVPTVAFPRHLDGRARRARFATSPASVVAFASAGPGPVPALLAPLHAHLEAEAPDRATCMGRRTLLGAGGGGLVMLLAACASSSKASILAASSTTATAATTRPTAPPPTSAPTTAAAGPTTPPSAGAGTVPLAVEMTQGPYYLDLNLVRRDVREDRTGVAFDLGFVVLDPAGRPVPGAAVDIWHCDANGIYSGFVSASTSSNGGAGGAGGGPGGPPPGGPGGPPPSGGAGQPGGVASGAATPSDPSTFLRGTQITDATGSVGFVTVYPGWYTGRTVHIHVMVHVAGRAVHTGQLFFDDAATDALYAAHAPYSARPSRTTRNRNDGIYANGGDRSVLAVHAAGDGYAATQTMAVKTA